MIYGSIAKCYTVGHGQRNEWECRLGYQVVSENTETNTREILLQLEARSINTKYTAVGYLLTPTIDGQQLNAIPMNFSQANTNVWQVLGTKVVKIVGAYNGIKYGSFETNLTGAWDLKSGSANVYIVLDNLHTPPQITSIDSEEINSTLNGYDGIAQFLSVKNYTFHTETFDDATISSYQIHHNGVLIGSSEENGMTINFDTVGTLATFEMNGKTYCTLKFVVIDSFGVSKSKEAQVEVTKYVKPNLVQTSSNIKRNGQLSGKVKMTLVGSFFNQSINGVVNNIDLKFKYWKKGTTEPTEYNNIPYEPTDNNIGIYSWEVAINDKEIEDVSSKSAYTFKIKATDYFNKTSEIELLCPVGEYLWAEFKDRVDFKAVTIEKQKISIPYVLYDDTSGSFGTIPLNKNKNDFKELEIIASSNSGAWKLIKISTTIEMFRISIVDNNTSGNNAWFKQNTYVLNNNEITFDSGFWRNINSNEYAQESAIKIYKVIGYK